MVEQREEKVGSDGTGTRVQTQPKQDHMALRRLLLLLLPLLAIATVSLLPS
jgi:hypothetical protein